MLAADFMAAIAFKLDQQFTRGDGTGENMTGLRNQSGSTGMVLIFFGYFLRYYLKGGTFGTGPKRPSDH